MQTAPSRWRRLALIFVAAHALGTAVETEPAAVPEQNWPELRDRTFAIVWETVNDSYYDAAFGGVDWPAVREKYQAWLPAAADKAALRQLLMGMLGELRRTHFSILPREMAVFTPAERTRTGTAGVEVAFIENAVVVCATTPDHTGQLPPVRPGEEIVRIGEEDLGSLRTRLQAAGVSAARCGFYLTQLVTSRLQSAVGSKISLGVRGLDGAERAVELVTSAHEGAWSEPMGDFPSVPVQCTTRTEPDGLAYLHFNVFVRPAMREIRSLLKAIPAGGGLVLDLRGNPGGITIMAPGISGWLSDREYLMATMHLRQGHIGFTVSPQQGAFLGPVAVLIDSRSASTSEIMAAGLQEAGRARIFGEASPGAALPSIFKALPTGDLFQYAIADLQTPRGMVIEGRGVTPDETVRRTRADLAGGRDPVLEAARHWLAAQRPQPISP